MASGVSLDTHPRMHSRPLTSVSLTRVSTAASPTVPDSKAGRVTSNPPNLVVVGYGLGGLAAAYCLAKAGHKIMLFEAAPAIGDVGARMQVTPNVNPVSTR
ncbi:hypothetical protein FRC08_003120 [Ceratobasidium sp. 394]|nr:hypothetical protein FRC08_003120 [Ceratobasidium sp. 394]